jgi:hypothetical protein
LAPAIVMSAAATGALALLAAGCGGSPGSHVAQLGSSAVPSTSASRPAPSTRQTGALAFSRCMRSHGVTNYPDPASSGELAKESPQQLGISGSEFQTAQDACVRMLPGGGQPTRAELRQSWSDFLNFARCMRRQGVSNWPDPAPYPQHPERPTFDLQPVGIDPNSPPITIKIHECEALLHGNNPQHLGEGGS